MKQLISIVIPCYRSAQMIEGVVNDINREMEQLQKCNKCLIVLEYLHLKIC